MTAAPFDAIHADPWADQIADLPGLNADVSAAIEETITRQRQGARRNPKDLRSTSLVVLGAPGAGKTHLFARLRQRLGPKAVFVHVRPLLNSEMTARFVLHEVAKQLGYATMGLRQIDALVGSLLAHLGGSSAPFPSAFLDDLARVDEAERERRLEEALENVVGSWQDVDEGYLRRLLAVPFASPATQRAALAWLSGRECDEVQLLRIGATASLPEEAVVPALRTLAAVASLGSPIVIVFDQLENLIDGHESRARLLAYANLAAELVDSARGIVLVHMAIETEWTRAIEPALSTSQRSRIVMRTKSLALPTAAEREALLRIWGAATPDPQGPFPWPFGERRVARWCSAPGMTPRMLLVECREAMAGAPDDGADAGSAGGHGAEGINDALAAEWARHLGAARQALDEFARQDQCTEPARLADGLAVAAGFVPGLALAVNLRELTQLTWATAKGKVRMAILNHDHPRSLGAALAKLAAIAETAPVLALRERAREIPPTWKDTLAKRAAFIAKSGARWVTFEREDSSKVLALGSFVTAGRSGDVTDLSGRAVPLDAVRAWIAESLDVPSWHVLAALRSEREGEGEEGDHPPVEPTAVPAAPGVAMSILRRLRVASLDRLVREVARADRTATRASTVLALEQASDRVRWIGNEVVCVKEES